MRIVMKAGKHELTSDDWNVSLLARCERKGLAITEPNRRVSNGPSLGRQISTAALAVMGTTV